MLRREESLELDLVEIMHCEGCLLGWVTGNGYQREHWESYLGLGVPPWMKRELHELSPFNDPEDWVHEKDWDEWAAKLKELHMGWPGARVGGPEPASREGAPNASASHPLPLPGPDREGGG